MISFRIACLVSTIVCLVLFAILLIAPANYVAGYGGPANDGAEFMGRRGAPMLLGLALITGLLRGSLDLAVQWVVSWAMIAAYVGVALTGIYAYVSGDAALSIIWAAAGEILLAGVFALTLRHPGQPNGGAG
ncbi:MAG: hypothetical protein AAFQ64_17745 [Pseudomonadota bacterium]